MHNEQLLTVMIQAFAERRPALHYSRPIARAAIAQGRVQDVVDAGLACVLTNYIGMVPKPLVEYFYLLYLEQNVFPCNNHVRSGVDVAHIQTALDKWVRSPNDSPEFEWFCARDDLLWGRLDYTKFKARFARKPDREYIRVLGTFPFTRPFIRDVFFNLVEEKRLKSKILRAAKGQMFKGEGSHPVRILRRGKAPYR